MDGNYPTVRIKLLRGGKPPRYMSEGASGVDLHAAIDYPVVITPGNVETIPTGIAISLPSHMEAQIRPRSGLAQKHNIGIINSPGTIDSDYRGEIKVLLINMGKNPFTVIPDMRIAQMVFTPILKVIFEVEENLDKTLRNKEGFGSTGIT